MPFVYILKSLSVHNWHYVGCCEVLEDRIKQHNSGAVQSTKPRRPLQLLFSKEFKTVTEARKFENYLKSPAGYLEKKKIIKDSKTSV